MVIAHKTAYMNAKNHAPKLFCALKIRLNAAKKTFPRVSGPSAFTMTYVFQTDVTAKHQVQTVHCVLCGVRQNVRKPRSNVPEGLMAMIAKNWIHALTDQLAMTVNYVQDIVQ